MFPTPRDAVEYIMETFPIVKRKDIKRTEIKNDKGEVTQPGRYITKETILEIYDEMATAIQSGHPYQTRLNPPPGPPVDAEGNFTPMAEWDESNWPEPFGSVDRCFLQSIERFSEIGVATGPDRDRRLFPLDCDVA